jgi:hypothetical protein
MQEIATSRVKRPWCGDDAIQVICETNYSVLIARSYVISQLSWGRHQLSQ